MRKTRIITHKQKSLAINLDWMPLLGEATVVKQVAKRMHASHKIISGKPASALGLAYNIKLKNCWSLAELFAVYHPKGTYVSIFQLDINSWHILACHEGVVLVHADRSFADKDSALNVVNQFSSTYPDLVFADIISNDDFFDKLISKADQANTLTKVSKNIISYLVPIALMASILLWQIWPQQSVATAKADELNHTELWSQAINNVLYKNSIHGLAGTQSLLKAINQQPLIISGWVLADLRCGTAAVASLWLCNAEYKRHDLNTDNKNFINHAPKQWRMEYPSLDLIRASWSLDLPDKPLNPEILPFTKTIERDWTSELQSILPAFTTLHLGPPAEIKIPVPTVEDGVEIPKPEYLPQLANRKLSLSGPLRSAVLLKNISDSIAWKKINIKYSPGVKADSKASSLIMQLEGNVYEKRI